MPLRSIAGTVAFALGLMLLPAPPASAQLRAALVATGFSRPLGLVQDPSNPSVQLVLEQGGRVRVLVNGVIQSDDFLDLTGQIASAGEQGLLGLAFAPDYATSGRVYVSFTNTSGHSVVARFERSVVDPLRLDLSTRFDLVWPGGQAFIPQPYANHKGGWLAFGPDGYLYFGLGDGGSGNDPQHLAQDPSSLLGKMLRLDVSVPDTHPQGYAVPPGNPFVGNAGVMGEIWAFGLRNPWRWSIDDPALGGTGAFVIADVGQGSWEEINYEPSGTGGRNYGWRNREGANDNVTSLPPFFTPLTDPIWQYARAVGRSITGGYVYRGSALPSQYLGRYFYGDFVTSRIWSLGLTVNASSGAASVTSIIEHTMDLGDASASPSSFGIDAAGELYVVSYAGSVFRLESASVAPSTPAPYPSCPTVQPGPDWTCVAGNWLPPGMTPPGGSLPPPSAPPPPPPPPAGGCTTVRPGPDWSCSNGSWLPPGLTPPAVSPPPSSPPPPSGGGCTTVQPGPAWTCRNGGWLPPGYPGT